MEATRLTADHHVYADLYARLNGEPEGGLPFGALAEGQEFRFPGAPEVMVKRPRGWYRHPNGKSFRTRKGTAVCLVK